MTSKYARLTCARPPSSGDCEFAMRRMLTWRTVAGSTAQLSAKPAGDGIGDAVPDANVAVNGPKLSTSAVEIARRRQVHVQPAADRRCSAVNRRAPG